MLVQSIRWVFPDDITNVEVFLDRLESLKNYILHSFIVYKVSLSFCLQEVKCDDESLQQVIQTAVTKLYQAIAPVKTSNLVVPSTSQPVTAAEQKT